MNYKNITHKENFLEVITKLQKFQNSAYCSALYILTIDEIWPIAKDYVNDNDILFDHLYRHDLESSVLFLIDVAFVLFNGSGDVKLSEYLDLDSDNIDLFYNTLKIRQDVSLIND